MLPNLSGLSPDPFSTPPSSTQGPRWAPSQSPSSHCHPCCTSGCGRGALEPHRPSATSLAPGRVPGGELTAPPREVQISTGPMACTGGMLAQGAQIGAEGQQPEVSLPWEQMPLP